MTDLSTIPVVELIIELEKREGVISYPRWVTCDQKFANKLNGGIQ